MQMTRKMTKIAPILLAYSKTVFVGNIGSVIDAKFSCTDAKFVQKTVLRHTLRDGTIQETA